MGTLFDQPARKSFDVDEHVAGSMLNLVLYLKDIHNITFEQAALIVELCIKNRANNLNHADNDVKDEQLYGFGEILQRLVSAIEDLSLNPNDAGND